MEDKAKQRALEQYPIEMYEDVGWRCADKNEYKRQYFVEGYHQAEKDLKLTEEDIRTILDCFIRYKMEIGWNKIIDEDDCAKEVLKRFKSYGKKEI